MSENAVDTTNRVAEVEKPKPQPRPLVPVQDHSDFRNLLDTNRFEHLWRLAQAFAGSNMIPDSFQGKPSNCFVALQMALRLKCDPFMLMQNTYVVYGRPGFEAKLAIALVNASGVFSDRIKYRLAGEGMARSCVAYATDAKTGEVIEQTVTMKMAKDEGWMEKKGSKWLTMPDLMLQYRAAMFLIRLHCPEVIMGILSSEELEDVPPYIVPSQPVKMEDLANPKLATEKVKPPPAKTKEPDPAKEEPQAGTPPSQKLDPDAEDWIRYRKDVLADLESAKEPGELTLITQDAIQYKDSMGHENWVEIMKGVDQATKRLTAKK